MNVKQEQMLDEINANICVICHKQNELVDTRMCARCEKLLEDAQDIIQENKKGDDDEDF